MAKRIDRLTAKEVQDKKEPGWYPVGRGLYLQVSRSEVTHSISKSWVYRYQQHGKEHRHGLGSLLDVSLKQARKAAEDCRTLRLEGIDPINDKRAKDAENRLR